MLLISLVVVRAIPLPPWRAVFYLRLVLIGVVYYIQAVFWAAVSGIDLELIRSESLAFFAILAGSLMSDNFQLIACNRWRKSSFGNYLCAKRDSMDFTTIYQNDPSIIDILIIPLLILYPIALLFGQSDTVLPLVWITFIVFLIETICYTIYKNI